MIASLISCVWYEVLLPCTVALIKSHTHCIHLYTHAQAYKAYTQIHHTHMHLHTHIDTKHKHIYVHTYTHAHTHTHTHTHTHKISDVLGEVCHMWQETEAKETLGGIV